MPTSYIKKLHEEGKGSIDKLESEWEKAKKNAADQGQGNNYAYITKIFQNRVGASSLEQALEVGASDTAYIDSLVAKGYDRKELDEAWAKAKKIADKAAKDNPNIQQSYAYTTGIFQNLIGIKASALTAVAATQIMARNNYIKKLAREGKHGTLKDLEAKWDEAIGIAHKAGIHAYGYATAVFQNLLGIKKARASKIEAHIRLASTAYPEAFNKGVQANLAGEPIDTYLTYENPRERQAFRLGWSSADDNGD